MDKLSVEKEFEVKKLETQIKGLTSEQLQYFFIEMYRQFLAREQMYQDLMKEKLWK
ncbi:MAG: hypothetical protein ACRC62_19605 [Microcoleus sp.]